MPSEFDELQTIMRAGVERRQAEARACEGVLNGLYHALRQANGPGLPLNNVTMEGAEDPSNRMRPVPAGGWHAVWMRLGLCEVYVRVRRGDTHFEGEYGPHHHFTVRGAGEAELLPLARQLLRDIAGLQGGTGERREVN